MPCRNTRLKGTPTRVRTGHTCVTRTKNIFTGVSLQIFREGTHAANDLFDESIFELRRRRHPRLKSTSNATPIGFGSIGGQMAKRSSFRFL